MRRFHIVKLDAFRFTQLKLTIYLAGSMV